MKKHRIAFRYRGEMDAQALDLAFNKTKAEDRKTWINGADIKDYLDTKAGAVTVADFVNKVRIKGITSLFPVLIDIWFVVLGNGAFQY